MSVRRFYGRVSRVYDAVATLPVVRRWRRRAVAALDLEPGDTVVEMGCGTGANLPALRRHVGSAGRIVGVDITRQLLKRAHTRVDRTGWSNVTLVHADAERPPVADADAVLATFVIGLLPDPAGTVATWCDLVRPDGRVALLEATRSDRLGPANVAFDLFVRLGAPTRQAGASVILEDRVEAAQTALRRRTSQYRQETFGLGFVELRCGTVRKSNAVEGGRSP